MNDHQDQFDDVVDLGVASVETHGAPGGQGEPGVIARQLGIEFE